MMCITGYNQSLSKPQKVIQEDFPHGDVLRNGKTYPNPNLTLTLIQ